MAKYLKSPLLNYDVLATAARQPGIYSLGRRASSYSRVQYTHRDDARRHDSSQGVKPTNDHDHDSPSLEVAYICQKYAEKYAAYIWHMHRMFCQILHFLPRKLSHTLRQLSAINQHP